MKREIDRDIIKNNAGQLIASIVVEEETLTDNSQVHNVITIIGGARLENNSHVTLKKAYFYAGKIAESFNNLFSECTLEII